MSDSMYAPPKAYLGSGNVRIVSPFYIVSPFKAVALLLGTMGIYSVHWHYQNWLLYKQDAQNARANGADIWVNVRALLNFLFVHAMLREADAHGRVHGRVAAGNAAAIATAMAVLTFAMYALGTYHGGWPKYRMAMIGSLVMLVPLAFSYRSAQRFINECCGDPLGKTNAKFTAANIGCLLAGALLWALMIYGLWI